MDTFDDVMFDDGAPSMASRVMSPRTHLAMRSDGTLEVADHAVMPCMLEVFGIQIACAAAVLPLSVRRLLTPWRFMVPVGLMEATAVAPVSVKHRWRAAVGMARKASYMMNQAQAVGWWTAATPHLVLLATL